MNIGEMNLEYIKNYLRIDGDEDDTLILSLLQASKDYIQTYTGMDKKELEQIPALVPAILILISSLYDNRTLDTSKKGSTPKAELVDNMLNLYCKNNIAH